MSSAVSVAALYQRRTNKRLIILVGFAALLVLSFVLDVATGPGNYSIAQVAKILLNSGSASNSENLIIWDIRMPVAVIALLVGAMLSASGAQMQTILNNPLADPFTLGIQSAAGFGAALAIVFGLDELQFTGSILITLSAFAFSLLTAFFLYLFIKLKGASAETLVLVGIALLFSFNALLSLLQFTATEQQLSQIVFWMMGSLGRANWENVTICFVVFLLIMPLFLWRTWALTAMRMGDDKATSLGINVKRIRVEMLFAISLLAATAVSFVGTIAFVGLVGPHIARMLVGEDQRFFLPMSILSGALLMSLTSIVSKSVTVGVVYPVGMITSLIGIPFFISLIMSMQRRNW